MDTKAQRSLKMNASLKKNFACKKQFNRLALKIDFSKLSSGRCIKLRDAA